MKTNIFKSYRWKMLWYVILSGILSIVFTVLLLFIALSLCDISDTIRSFFAELYNTFGIVIPGLAVIIASYIISFFIVTSKTVRYLGKISNSVDQIANGNLDVTVPIRGHDEFSQLAEDINNMAEQLRYSFDSQRSAEQAKSELITSVAHDLRTPLTSVIGYLQLLNDENDLPPEAVQRYVSVAYKKSLKLERLIDDLFDYTRYGNSGMVIRHDHIDLSELLIQLAEEYYPIFQSAGMMCRMHVARKMYIEGDGDLLARVFDNLFNNAIKYGVDKLGCDVYAERHNNYAVVRVVSYGETISPEKLDRIFEKFYRVEQSRSENTGGTGLGLPIARSIVMLHNGSIDVESSNGRTVFTVCLPLSVAEDNKIKGSNKVKNNTKQN